MYFPNWVGAKKTPKPKLKKKKFNPNPPTLHIHFVKPSSLLSNEDVLFGAPSRSLSSVVTTFGL